MSKLSELEGSQIFIFETNYYTQKVSNSVIYPHLPVGSLFHSSPVHFLVIFPPLLFFVVHLLAHIISRSSFCSPPLQDAVGPFPFSHSLFHLHYFGCSSFSYPPCHFSQLSSAPSLESAVFRSTGLLHCWLPSKLCPLYLLSFLKVSQKNNHPHNLMSQSASTMIVRSFNKILV